ncbi:MAG: hypothetical protein MPJ02_00060 [Nitrosopumilus sp.]|nr:hypothetical protein [Nitrosopumilus sp.]MDA7998784.1 hypothetical protein [Nitrosopumilus sp.]
MARNEEQDERPPAPFRRRYVPHWAAGAVVLLAVMAYFQHTGHKPPLDLTRDGVESLLYTSAGIFATMLAVTLGVTLLGVQFRSQSYTISGML